MLVLDFQQKENLSTHHMILALPQVPVSGGIRQIFCCGTAVLVVVAAAGGGVIGGSVGSVGKLELIRIT